MKVVLDTSVICQDYFFRKPHSQVLLEGAAVVPLELFVPQVVFDECVNKFAEHVDQAASLLKKAESAFGRLSNKSVRASIEPNPSETHYDSFLKAFLMSNNIHVAPYPKVSHQDIVARELARKKPFKSNGAGYRDALIWESFRYISRFGNDRSVFVSANIKDFGEGPRVPKDLEADFRSPRSIEVFPSVEKFNEKYVLPRLGKIEVAASAISAAGIVGFDLKHWIRSSLFNILGDVDFNYPVVGFDEDYGSVHIWEIVHFDCVEVDDIRSMSGDRYVIRVVVDVTCVFSVSCDMRDYFQSPAVRDFFGPPDGEFDSISAELERAITATVDLIVHETTGRVESSELVSISGDYGEIELGGW
ncbi:MAG: PIN domain-containing protein [Phycisphaerales bacterium]